MLQYQVFCVSGTACVRLKGSRNSLATVHIIRNTNKSSPLRNVRQYIFPTLYNTLNSKNSKYAIYNIHYRRDVSLCMRLCKEIIKKENKGKINNI